MANVKEIVITITASPFAPDYDDEFNKPPWSYNAEAFIDWVDEVLCEGYKRVNPEMTLNEAIRVAEGVGYTIVSNMMEDQ